MTGRIGTIMAGLLVAAAHGNVVAQGPRVALSASAGLMQANGLFTTVRQNGKQVRSDIDGGPYFAGRLTTRLNDRWSVRIGYEGSRSRDFRIDQEFPDGTDFSSSDSFAYHAVTLGGQRSFVTNPGFEMNGSVYLAVAWFDDVSLESAGPPYDRVEPIDVDVDTRPGFGFDLGFVWPIARSAVAIESRIGVTVVRFSGPFPDDPSIPGSGGDIDVPLNPAYLTVGVRVGR